MLSEGVKICFLTEFNASAEVEAREVNVEDDVEGKAKTVCFADCGLLLVIIAVKGLLTLLFTFVGVGFNVSFGSKKQALSVIESLKMVVFGK